MSPVFSKQHGDFVLTMVNDVVLVNARGPWNKECVDNFGVAYAASVYQNGKHRWSDIVMLTGESLLVPEAEAALRVRIERAVMAGLAQVFVVTERSSVATTSTRQIKALYANLPVSLEIVNTLDGAVQRCSKLGFDCDAKAVTAFFNKPFNSTF